MNLGFLVVGLGKIGIALALTVACVGMAIAVPRRLLALDPLAPALRDGNTAVALVDGAALLALALLCRQPLVSAFAALDFLGHGGTDAQDLGLFLGYLAVHIGITLALGTGSIVVATLLFNRWTSGVDEIAEIRRGNVAPAVVLAAVVVATAILLAPGLEAVLDAFLPWPDLGGPVRPPS